MDRDGGILVAYDSLQNLVTSDKYFSDQSRQMMREMGFFQLANFGPVWVQVNEPKAWDFVLPHLQTLGRCIAPDLIGMGDCDKLVRLVATPDHRAAGFR